MWLVNGAHKKDIQNQEYKDVIETFQLKKDDGLIVEWLGSEYVYDDKLDTTYTLKNVKFTTVKGLKGTWIPAFIDRVEAWVSDDLVRLDDPAVRGALKVTKVLEGDVDPLVEAMDHVLEGLPVRPDEELDAPGSEAKNE